MGILTDFSRRRRLEELKLLPLNTEMVYVQADERGHFHNVRVLFKGITPKGRVRIAHKYGKTTVAVMPDRVSVK